MTLNRGRSDVQLPDFTVSVGKSKIGMNIPESWLDFHPLTKADLASEACLRLAASTAPVQGLHGRARGIGGFRCATTGLSIFLAGLPSRERTDCTG